MHKRKEDNCSVPFSEQWEKLGWHLDCESHETQYLVTSIVKPKWDVKKGEEEGEKQILGGVVWKGDEA